MKTADSAASVAVSNIGRIFRERLDDWVIYSVHSMRSYIAVSASFYRDGLMFTARKNVSFDSNGGFDPEEIRSVLFCLCGMKLVSNEATLGNMEFAKTVVKQTLDELGVSIRCVDTSTGNVLFGEEVL